MAYSPYTFKKDIINTFVLLGLLITVFFFGILKYSPFISTCFIAAAGIFIIAFIKIEAGLVFLIAAMLFSPEISLGTIFHRNITVRLEDILIPILFFAWLGRLAIKREPRLLVKNPLNIPVLVYITICIISTVRGVGLGYVRPLAGLFFNLKLIEFFFIYFFVVNFVKTAKQVKYFLIAILLTALAISLYGLYQVPKVEIWSQYRITAPFEGSPEPATMGAYLTLILAIALSLFLYTPTPLQKWAYGSLSVIITIPLLYTLSRASYISCLFMLFVLSILSKKKLLIFSLVIFLLLSPIILPQEVLDRISYTWRDARELGVDPSTQERIYSWRKAYNTIKEHPFLGYGVGARDIKDNQYLRVITETGLVGFFLFLWIMVRIYKCGMRLFKRAKGWWIKALSVGYIAGFIGILVHAMGTITFYIVRIMEPFWFFTGMIMFLYLSYDNIGREDER